MSEILRPNGNVTVSLYRSTGSTNYVLVDESTLDTADYVYAISDSGGGTGSGSDLYSCGSYTKVNTVAKVEGKFNLGKTVGGGDTPGSVSFTLRLYTGSTQLATVTTSNTGWQTVTYTGDLTQSEIDNLQLYVYIYAAPGKTTSGKETYIYTSQGFCYMCYAEVTESTGWANILKVKGATATDLAKVSGVAVGDIAKYKGAAV